MAWATSLGQRQVPLFPPWRPDLTQPCSLAPSGKSMGNRACEAQKPRRRWTSERRRKGLEAGAAEPYRGQTHHGDIACPGPQRVLGCQHDSLNVFPT